MIKAPQGIEQAAVNAVLEVESGGVGLVDGKPTIRFEPHIFRRYLGDDRLFSEHFRYGSPVWAYRQMNDGGGWKSIETAGQGRQWEAYELAATLNREAAAKSMSMGAAQIMGFNHASVGYDSAQAMLEAFYQQDAQDAAFLRFIMARPMLVAALKAKDWRTFALGYNGSGLVDTYSARLERAYRKHSGG